MNAVRVLLCGVAALLVGCAGTGPEFKTEGVATGLTPREASTRAADIAGTRVLWGGVIVNSTNLENATQLEVLGYPLDDSQEPQTDAGPAGRFLVIEPGYLETADYAQGRRITVVGPVTGTRQGKIGESAYTYPVVDPDRIHLWPRASTQRYTEPRFHFGVGVIFGR
ncbi:MAG: Slp family lipoprotein [Thiohalomonadaceae bacterium]